MQNATRTYLKNAYRGSGFNVQGFGLRGPRLAAKTKSYAHNETRTPQQVTRNVKDSEIRNQKSKIRNRLFPGQLKYKRHSQQSHKGTENVGCTQPDEIGDKADNDDNCRAGHE